MSDPAPSRGNTCEDDRCEDKLSPVWYCIDCDTCYCEDCWPKQGPHKPGKVGRDGEAHEQSDFEVLQVYKNILHPPSQRDTLRQMHEEDTETLWFGVTKDENGDTRFEDHARYAALMSESPSPMGIKSPKYPRLVSFVGTTNAGKSTIIKMLIDRPTGKGKAPAQNIRYPSPVVGSAVNDKVPTSGDVHLYADPGTFTKEYPVLYADCEGMEGGEAPPIGSQTRKRSSSINKASKKRHRSYNSNQRDILWATNETTRKREYAVTELYPRLLYTFSDVVVFVMRNAKVFQSSVLKKLLDWGAASLEKSLNQPTLPHAIIVLNATEMGVDQEEWDPRIATERLLDTVKHGLDRISGVPELRALADQWRDESGIEIRGVRDLILRYYSSFTVVRIPVKGRYTLMDQQARRLHDEIMQSCEESFQSKRRARMATNSDDFNIYLQAAFDHFTSGLDRPFNFIEVALKNNPLPETFTDHILQLALAIQQRFKLQQKSSARWILDQVGRIVASCIMLDVVRYRKGSVDDLFESYVDFLEMAFEDFFDTHWPCSYTNKKGQKCTIVRARHDAKGHQNDSGKIIGSGGYESTLEDDDAYLDKWIEKVRSELMILNEDLRRREERVGTVFQYDHHALEIHRTHLTKIFHGLDRLQKGKLISHSTCFCCLKENPEHSLPCGHVLCTTCVKAYARPDSNCLMVMEYCPLHFREMNDRFAEPWRIAFKPDFAGVRVLSLDGGGVRGIVELEVLRAIEGAIGCGLPIQAFFDLIVGTSTGGIISLAVGVKQWRLDKCIQKFLELCHEAFTERELAGIPGLEQLATLNHGSKYKTTPLRKALKKTLGEGKLFGGQREQNPDYNIKVAVTATSGTGRDALVLSNYSRNQDKTGQYEFIRAGRPDLELQIDEAAAATSAAPGYFKHFYCDRSSRSFLDGALYHNNPVYVAQAERKLLWPDVADHPPDILVSIGTGTCADIGKELAAHSGNSDKDLNIRMTAIRDDLQTASKKKDRPGKTSIFKTFKALYTRFDNILDAELTWKGFKTALATTTSQHANNGPFPFIRLNPVLGYQPPALDAKYDVVPLRDQVVSRLSTGRLKTEIQRVAHQLIASTFFFVRTQPVTVSEHRFSCKGSIGCRFEKDSQDIRKLGEVLRLQVGLDFSPYFTIQETRGNGFYKEIPLTSQVIDTMINKAAFEMDPYVVEIELSHQAAPIEFTLALRDNTTMGKILYSISGFPRTLGIEDSAKNRQVSSTGIMKHKQAVRRRSKRHNLRASGHTSPSLDKVDRASISSTVNRPDSESDEDLVKAFEASMAESNLSPQTTRDTATSSAYSADYVTTTAEQLSSGDAVPRTEDAEEAQFRRDMEEALRRSEIDLVQPKLPRTPTAEMEEFKVAVERSKRHYVK